MKIHPDDPLITSYVLGELEPADAKAVALAIDADPLLQQRVAEITGTQRVLTGSIRPPTEVLLPHQREKIRRNVRKARGPAEMATRRLLGTRLRQALAAAGLVVILVVGGLMMLGRSVKSNAPQVHAARDRGASETSAQVDSPPASAPVPSLPAPKLHGYLTAAEVPILELPLAASGASLTAVADSIMNLGKRPAREVVRLEEMLNHFSLRLGGLTAVARGGLNRWHPDDREGEEPTAVVHAATLSAEMLACPWKPSSTLLLISLRGGPQGDAQVKLAYRANAQNVLRYRLLGFDPCEGRVPGTLPTQLAANGTCLLAIEIEPFRPAGELGVLEWSVEDQAAPAVSLVHRSDAEPSDDARFAALICTFGQWLAGDELEIIDSDTLTGLAREIRSDTLTGDRADFLRLIDRSLEF
jgi:anti-sigma factor RsiW